MELYDGSKLVYDIEICKDIYSLKNTSDIVIYGAGGKGKEIFLQLKRAGIAVSFFCDLDMGKWGDCIENVTIISPFEIGYRKFSDNRIIYMIACVEQPQEVINLFRYMRLGNVQIITYWGIRMALYLNKEHLYGKGSKEANAFQIEKIKRRNRFINLGFSFMHTMLTAPDDAVWILQPGKTASSTLVRRLEEKKVSYVKLHSLEYPQHILGEEFSEVWKNMVNERMKKPFKIITAVREPISRDYSAFWQAFSDDNEMAMEMSILNKDFQKTYNKYIDLILSGNEHMKKILGMSMIFPWGEQFEWFDEQIKKYLDIDVFKYPFDKIKGYTIIKKGNVELLLYKVEKMESILDTIASFVGTAGLSKTNENVGGGKWYGLASSQFRRELKISRQYTDHYYRENPKMDHFYSLEEKECFLEKWEENII